MGDKLVKSDFNKQYRFRQSRSTLYAARCALCRHFNEGYCNHSKRSRRVQLFNRWFFGVDEPEHRWEHYSSSVCDAVEITVPDSIVFPELAGQGDIECWGGKPNFMDLLHADPRCPYIAARIIDDGLGVFPLSNIKIRNVSRWATAAPYDLCELPQCTAKNGLKPGRPDQYLRSQNLPDGYVYVPPPPKLLDFSSVDDPIESRSFMSTLSGFGISVNVTEQDILDMIQVAKQLAHDLGLPHTPHKEQLSQYYRMSWVQFFIILRKFGWYEVADRLAFEIAVTIDERLYCIDCMLKRNVYGQQNNPVRHRADPYCPVCGNELVDHLRFHNAIPSGW